jgi:hypothetical protein
MAKTHMLGLERIQYRALRIGLGLRLMGSTPNNCLGVFGGIPPLAERFAYLYFRYLVAGCERRREGLYTLCQGFDLEIALFDRILVDFELLKIWTT